MQQKKKLMLLGGGRNLLPVIKAAHNHNIHVITVDCLPNNIAHKYSEEFHNVSILDKEAVLQLAEKLKIDGIMSFGVASSVVTASYVAEKLGLNFQYSHSTACILQNKAKFRRFLAENNFNVPNAKDFSNIDEALADIDYFNWPVIVKPVDSVGNKGVSWVDNPENLPQAIENALNESRNGHFVIEDFLEKAGKSFVAECFTINGKLVYCSFSDQHFDSHAKNPDTPTAYSWPSTMPQEAQDELRRELQRLMTSLNVRTGIHYVETCSCANGKTYIINISPRGIGNSLAEMLPHITHTDLIDKAVLDAIGEKIDNIKAPVYDGYLAEVILHADKTGKFDCLEISDDIKSNIIETDLWVNHGHEMQCLEGTSRTIGTLVMKLDSLQETEQIINNISDFCKIKVNTSFPSTKQISENKTIYALGVGHNTPVFIDIAESCGYEIIGLFHYNDTRNGENDHGFKILGSFEDLFSSEDLEGKNFLLTMGDMKIRAELMKRIISLGGNVPTLIHPKAEISRFATISPVGVYVSAFTHVQADTSINCGTVALSGVNISHTNKVGRHCFFAGNSTLGAYTEMGDYVFVGQGALSISGKAKIIGNHSYIGARALITHDVAPYSTMVGIPAKPYHK